MSHEVTVIRSGVDGNSGIESQGFEVMNHPSGVYGYTKSWSDKDGLGVVKFERGNHSFEIDDVSILTGLGDSSVPENGVDNWSVMIKLGAGKAIAYEEARDRVALLLSKLRAAGWGRYIETSDPRLSGKAAMQYELSEAGQIYSLDSNYMPTVEEWAQLVNVEPLWQFYADGVFVDLTVSYWTSGGSNMGNYLVNIKISSAADNYSPYFSDDSDDKKRNWKKYLSDKLKPARRERSMREAKLDPHVYSIDTAYREPPFEAPDFSGEAGAIH
ncbi:hypothetical protein BLA50215_04817 [Burkholderia lata]|nr:hypothetical protein BLA50215_04817 [Burkholderia lata]